MRTDEEFYDYVQNKMQFSHTSLSTFRNCKLQFKLDYTLDRDGTTTIDAFMGACVHKVMEKLYKDKMNGVTDTLEDLLSCYDKIWKDDWAKSKVMIVKEEMTEQGMYNVGEKCIRDYYAKEYPFDKWNIIGIETKKYIDLDDNKKYHIRIDKLCVKDGTYYVCDYKTSVNMKTQEEADKDTQLAMYAKWVMDTYNTRNVKLVWHMVRFGEDVVSEKTYEQLEKIESDAIETIDEIRVNKVWEPTESHLCDYCRHKSICPLFSHVVKIEEEIKNKTYTKDEGAKLVDEYEKLEAEKKDFENKAKENKKKMDDLELEIAAFAKQFGYAKVAGLNKTASIKESKSVTVPGNKEEFYDLLRKKGLWEKYSQYSSSKVKSDVISGEFDKELESKLEIKDVVSVSFRKKKDSDEDE